MATYTQLINSVLRKLRESTISSPTDTTYSTLIGALVNETKREVEDSYPWTALKTTIDVTTAQGTSQYAVTGAGERWRLQTRTKSVFNGTTLYHLTPRPVEYVKHQARVNTQQSQPIYYYFTGVNSSGDPYINFYPTPDGVYTINVDLIVPQADLASGSTVITVPSAPVILGAWAKAIDERGEDGGQGVGDAITQYHDALADAISHDSLRNVGEDTWYV